MSSIVCIACCHLQIDFYENELDRGRSRQHDFAAQENKLILAQNEANRQRELLAQLRRELDCSIPYEMKDGQLMVRSLMSSNPLEDSGVHDPRSAGGGSEVRMLSAVRACVC